MINGLLNGIDHLKAVSDDETERSTGRPRTTGRPTPTPPDSAGRGTATPTPSKTSTKRASSGKSTSTRAPTTTARPSSTRIPASRKDGEGGVRTTVLSEGKHCPYPYPGEHCGHPMTTIVTRTKTASTKTTEEGSKTTG
jgi:hypothetical protein